MAPVITLTIQPPVDPDVPTPTYYQQLAAELMNVFEQLNALIPKLEESEGVDGKVFRANLGVPEQFCLTAITAVEQLPELAGGRTFETEKNRNRLQFVEAFRPVFQKGFATLKRVERAVRAAKSMVATESLQVYRVAKGYASDNKSPLIESFAAALKRDLGRKTTPKAEREARKAKKLDDLVEKKIAQRAAQGLLTIHSKEVKAA